MWDKPLMIWFPSIDELLECKETFNSDMSIVKCIELNIQDDYSQSPLVVLHRYVDQMDETILRNCSAWIQKYNKPVIYLATSESLPLKTNFVNEDFEEIEIVDRDPKTVVLISCSSKQFHHQAVAFKLYISTLFKKSWDYAKSIYPDRIFILSTKYGLLNPNVTRENYDVKTPKLGWKHWGEDVAKALAKENIDVRKDNIIILAGDKYVKALNLPKAILPLDKLPVGKRLQKLNQLLIK